MIDHDAYGHEIYDYHRGRHSIEIVERDDGLVDCSSGLPGRYFSEYPDWPEYEKRAMEFVQGRVLDIGCGAGRTCLYLQGLGHEVVAVDISPLAIRVCRERGVRDARVMSITGLNSRMGHFDTILMMGNNFGLLENRRRAGWLLRRFRAMVGPGGRIIATSNDPYMTEEEHHLEYHQLNIKRGRMPGQARIRVRYMRFVSNWFDYLLVSPEEMVDILEGTGWHVKQFIKSKGSTYAGIIERDG